jgi:predicted ferric reductase
MMGVQFVLTARFRRATAPYGIDIVYYFHRYLALVTLAMILLHPVILVVVEPAAREFLSPWRAPASMTLGVGSVLATLVLVGVSLGRKQMGMSYERWRWTHGLLAILAIGLAVAHIRGVGYYVAMPWKRTLAIFALVRSP